MEVIEGIRVVCGPDWSWGNEDSCEGFVGTLIETLIDFKMNPFSSAGKSANQIVVVTWDNGVTSNC